MKTTINPSGFAQQSERAGIQHYIESFLTDFQDFYKELSDRNPNTNILVCVEERGGFDKNKIDRIHEHAEKIVDAIREILHEDSVNAQLAEKLLDEINIDWLYKKMNRDAPFYQVITFNVEDRVSNIIEEDSENWQFGDDVDRCVEYATPLAHEEFENLVDKSDIDNVIVGFEKMLETLTSLARIIHK